MKTSKWLSVCLALSLTITLTGGCASLAMAMGGGAMGGMAGMSGRDGRDDEGHGVRHESKKIEQQQ